MKRIIITALLTAGVALGASAPAQAQCSWFGSDADNSICGVPNLGTSLQNGLGNLKTNLSPSNAISNLKKNLGIK